MRKCENLKELKKKLKKEKFNDRLTTQDVEALILK